MDLHYLKLFHTLAIEQNYTKAANSLFISQPALSMQIKKFEEELGMKLFDRVGSKTMLNENGKLLFQYTQQVFTILEEAEHQLLNKADNIRGSVSIGGSNTSGIYILPKIIGEFMQIYPEVKVNLHVSNTYEISYLVAENKLDFAINGGILDYFNNVHGEKLMEDPILLVISPENKLAQKDFIEPEDMRETNFILHEAQSQLYKLDMKIIEEMNFPSEITMTFGSIDAIKQAVCANMGASLLPLTAIYLELRIGLMKELKIKDKSWSYPHSLIYNKNRYLSPAAKKLMEYVRQRVIQMDAEK